MPKQQHLQTTSCVGGMAGPAQKALSPLPDFIYGSFSMRNLNLFFKDLHAKVLVTAGLLLASGGDVYAQSAANAVNNGINFSNLIAKLLVALFALGGLGAVGRGAFLFIKKGGERGDDI